MFFKYHYQYLEIQMNKKLNYRRNITIINIITIFFLKMMQKIKMLIFNY